MLLSKFRFAENSQFSTCAIIQGIYQNTPPLQPLQGGF